MVLLIWAMVLLIWAPHVFGSDAHLRTRSGWGAINHPSAKQGWGARIEKTFFSLQDVKGAKGRPGGLTG